MRLLAVLAVLALIATSLASVPKFTIDLNRRPYDRWREVGKEYGSRIQTTIDVGLRDRFPKYILNSLTFVSQRLEKYMPQPYLDEVRGLAAYGNISISGLVFIQLLYEATAHCTSIVCVTNEGVVWHARNLDYGLNPDEAKLLKAISIEVNFEKDGKSVYKGTTFAGLLGLATGISSNGFSVSLNQRDKGSVISNLLSFIREIIISGKFRPVFMEIRTVLSTLSGFKAAVAHLSTRHLIAPCYLIIGGLRNNEGVVITRNQRKAIDIQTLNTTTGRWFLLETNYDNWLPPPPDDDRRDPGIRAMKNMTRNGINVVNLFGVLWTPPVKNNKTIYSSVMSASSYALTSEIP